VHWQWQRADINAEDRRLAADAAVVNQRKAEANAELAWRSFRGVLASVNGSPNTPVSVLRKRILHQVLLLHQEYLSTIEDLPRGLELGRIAYELGELYHASDDLPNAEKYYQTAIEVFEGLHVKDPGNREFTSCLTGALNATARLFEGKQPPQALAPLDRCITLLKSMIQESNERTLRVRLIYALETQAMVNRKLSADWESSMQEARRWISQLETKDPLPNDNEVITMARCRKTYATFLLQDLRLAEALTEAQAAYQAACKLARDNPELDNLQQLFTVCSSTLGVVHSKRNDHVNGEALSRQNVEVYRSLLLRDPENPHFHSNLGGSLNNLAISLGRQDKIKEALASVQSAIEEQRIALQHYPNNRLFRDFMYNHHKTLTRLLIQNKNHPQAKSAASQLATIPQPRGLNYFETAYYLCQAAELAAKDQNLEESSRRTFTQQCGNEAMTHLKTAIKQGFFDKSRLQSPAFRLLKDREDYQQLFKDMSAVPTKGK
jgi:tetratricopeptide (TPR) repeat protein